MSYDVLICVFIMLIFCFLMQIFTVKVMIALFNSHREEGTRKIKPIKFIDKQKKKHRADVEKAQKQQKQFETLMENLDMYDGTSVGQKEVEF